MNLFTHTHTHTNKSVTSLSSGILPPHSDSHALVACYRRAQYQDIVEALEVMRYISSSTPSTHVYLRMFQLENQVLPRCSETSPPVRPQELFFQCSSELRVFVFYDSRVRRTKTFCPSVEPWRRSLRIQWTVTG